MFSVLGCKAMQQREKLGEVYTVCKLCLVCVHSVQAVQVVQPVQSVMHGVQGCSVQSRADVVQQRVLCGAIELNSVRCN